tara:strand:- start:1846 stop:1959 length:114 start_codon:yes stop_codon:yes gene_type:complete
MSRNRRVRLEDGDYTSGGIYLEEEEDLDEELEEQEDE